MKLTAFLLTIGLLNVSAKTVSQNITYSAENISLERVFAHVKRQTGYAFFYTEATISGIKPVSIKADNIPLPDFLNLLFKNQPLQYKIESKTIYISRRPVAVLPLIDTLITVRGKLLNQQATPVEGATIQVKGTKKAAVSNAGGEFIIREIGANSILIISSVEYERKEIKLTGQNELTLQLNVRPTDLKEVAVTVSTGYQQMSREKATGSFSHIDNKLLNRAVSPDILSRIKGVAAGVLFDQSAANNIGVSIRGRSTIYGNTQPLIVLNNLPFQGNLNDINPNDVESITVLKDAAASAMWGALSGNGVIVITTKKGKNNQAVKLNFNTNLTVKEKPDLFYSQQFMDPSEFIDLEIDLFRKGWYNGDISSIVGTPISPVVEILDKRSKGIITPGDSASGIDALRKYDIRRDYSKYLYRPSVLQQYYLSLSGGNDKSNYYISGGYDKDMQTVRHNDNDRASLTAQMTFTPLQNLEFSVGTMLSLNNVQANGISSISSQGKNLNIYPYARLADDNGNPLPVIKDFAASFVNNPPANGLLDWSYVPLEEYKYTGTKGKTTSNRINAGVKYTLFKSLNIQFNYLRQSGISNTEQIVDQNAYGARNLINQYSVVTAGNVTARNVPLGSIVSNTHTEISSQSGRGQMNYAENFHLHSINAMAGIDVIDNKTTSNVSTVYGYDVNTGASIPVNFQQRYSIFPSGQQMTILGGPVIIPYTQDRFRSFFANAGYSFDNKYFFTISAKIDQSNLFGVKANQRSVPLWSMGTRWNIAKEQFYNIEWLPLLNLKASYGYNGNYDNSISALTVIEHFSENINGQPWAVIKSAGNPQLRWEKISMMNLSLEFQLKNGALSGSLEYYRRKGIDMIGNSALPSSSGFYGIRGNFSNMKASGVDIVLNSNNIRGAVSWYSDLILSFTTNEVTKNEGINRQIVGRPVQSIYSYRWGGLDALTGDPIGYLADTLSKNYTAIIRAASNDPTRLIYSGPASPRFFGALRNTIAWKALTISANITFKSGYYFMNNSLSYLALVNFGLAHRDYEKRWQKKGDEATTNVPSFVFPVNNDRENFYQGSEINVEKGDHIRLQDVNISYDINRKNVKFLPFLQQVKLYGYINNICLLWKANDKGIDPDFISGYVTPRSYAVGLNLSF